MSEFIVPMADEAHANGTLRDGTVVEFARESRITLPTKYINADGQRRWTDYIFFHKAYGAGVNLINTPERLYKVTRLYLEESGKEGCVYVDFLSAGMNNYRKGDDPWEKFKGNTLETLKAMEDARRNTGIESSLVITMKRHLDHGVEQAEELIGLTIRFKKEGLDEHNRVRAIHLAGDEIRTTCRQFAPAYNAVYDELGFDNNGVHAGEVRNAQDIWDAIALPGVKRGTHLVSAVEDPQLMDELYKRRFMVSFALSSNEILQPERFRNPRDHSIRKIFDHGIPAGIQTDDPGPLGITIGGEYQKAHTVYGFNKRELFLFTINTVRHGFGAPEARQEVLGRLADFNRAKNLALPIPLFDLNCGVDLREIVQEIADHPKQLRVFGGSVGNSVP